LGKYGMRLGEKGLWEQREKGMGTGRKRKEKNWEMVERQWVKCDANAQESPEELESYYLICKPLLLVWFNINFQIPLKSL